MFVSVDDEEHRTVAHLHVLSSELNDNVINKVMDMLPLSVSESNALILRELWLSNLHDIMQDELRQDDENVTPPPQNISSTPQMMSSHLFKVSFNASSRRQIGDRGAGVPRPYMSRPQLGDGTLRSFARPVSRTSSAFYVHKSNKNKVIVPHFPEVSAEELLLATAPAPRDIEYVLVECNRRPLLGCQVKLQYKNSLYNKMIILGRICGISNQGQDVSVRIKEGLDVYVKWPTIDQFLPSSLQEVLDIESDENNVLAFDSSSSSLRSKAQAHVEEEVEEMVTLNCGGDDDEGGEEADMNFLDFLEDQLHNSNSGGSVNDEEDKDDDEEEGKCEAQGGTITFKSSAEQGHDADIQGVTCVPYDLHDREAYFERLQRRRFRLPPSYKRTDVLSAPSGAACDVSVEDMIMTLSPPPQPTSTIIGKIIKVKRSNEQWRLFLNDVHIRIGKKDLVVPLCRATLDTRLLFGQDGNDADGAIVGTAGVNSRVLSGRKRKRPS